MNEDYALRCSVIGCDAQLSHDDSSIDRIKKYKVRRVFLWRGVAQQHATNGLYLALSNSSRPSANIGSRLYCSKNAFLFRNLSY